MAKITTSCTMVLLVLFLAIGIQPETVAWSNGGYSSDPGNPDYGTHDWIADNAIAIQTMDANFLKTTYHARFLLGTEAPDNSAYIGDSTNHHVYYYSSGDLQDGKSAIRASQMYQIALGYMASQDLDNAAYYTGAMTHYVADVGVFGHTMGSGTDWGAEDHHSDYENAIESMTGSLSSPTGVSLGDSDTYAATVDLANIVTFGGGAIMPNIWMDNNYNWADSTFVTSAMASLNSSVAAVAAVVNHLLVEAGAPSTSPDPQAPQPPVSLRATVIGASIGLSWSPPTNDGGRAVTGYEIFRGTDPDNPSLMSTVADYARSWTDESVEKGKTYYYWVVAVNSVGSSGMSTVASATIPREQSSFLLPISVSSALLAFAAGGAMLWRRRARSKSHP
jgi:hypothetical protein